MVFHIFQLFIPVFRRFLCNGLLTLHANGTGTVQRMGPIGMDTNMLYRNVRPVLFAKQFLMQIIIFKFQLKKKRN